VDAGCRDRQRPQPGVLPQKGSIGEIGRPAATFQ
jgi:hypothetical protein